MPSGLQILDRKSGLVFDSLVFKGLRLIWWLKVIVRIDRKIKMAGSHFGSHRARPPAGLEGHSQLCRISGPGTPLAMVISLPSETSFLLHLTPVSPPNNWPASLSMSTSAALASLRFIPKRELCGIFCSLVFRAPIMVLSSHSQKALGSQKDRKKGTQ